VEEMDGFMLSIRLVAVINGAIHLQIPVARCLSESSPIHPHYAEGPVLGFLFRGNHFDFEVGNLRSPLQSFDHAYC